MPVHNRIWIELDWPEELSGDAAKEFMERQCKLATQMLTRLLGADAMGTYRFYVGDRRGSPVYCFGNAMGYEELTDKGKWFNLDFLAQG